MENLKEQVLKLQIIYAKKPVLEDIRYSINSWQKKPRLKDGKGILKKEIEPYKNITKKSNIYLKLGDRLFYSETLSAVNIVAPEEVKKELIRYILEGITVSKTAIETIVIKTTNGTYHIGDICEIVGREELIKNFKKL